MGASLIDGCSNFTWAEAGSCLPDDIRPKVARFARRLEELRKRIGDQPIIINSWYRSPSHPIEKAKDKPGAHTTGQAADIRCDGVLARQITEAALSMEFGGIGIKQHGPRAGRFIHLDDAHEVKVVWTY